MEEPTNKMPALVNIAADGDIILLVGPEKIKLRVHSLFLKAASKPFSALLGPDWMEGNKMLDRDGPVEILLPEDDADALNLLCAILHHQNKDISQTLSAGDVLGVAVMADKYDCLDALKFASGHWLRPGSPVTTKAGDLILLMAAAYLFQNTRVFKEITRALVLNYGGSYLDLICEDVESVLPWKLFCKSLNDSNGPQCI
jgi:hypothetical protein